MDIVKYILKKILFTICIIITFPLAVIYKIFSFAGENDSLFSALGQFFSLVPGKFGSYLRVAFYFQVLRRCSPDIFIGFCSYFSHCDIQIEKGVYVGAYCIVGKSKLEKNVTIGSGVHILSGKSQHNYSVIGKPIQEQGGHYKTVVIGENSWIGSGAIVLSDIGKQCVIGAGAVVSKKTDDYEMLVGNPAKVIKKIMADG